MIRGGELLGYVSVYIQGINYIDEEIGGEIYHILKGSEVYSRGLPVWNTSRFEKYHEGSMILESWEVPNSRRWRMESVKWV